MLCYPRAAQTPITIKDFAFQPATATEEAGVAITWTNTDGTDHTVTFDTINVDSGDLPADASFSTTIATPGTYSYHCAFHPFMTGSITVVPQQAPPPALTPRAWLPMVVRSLN